jgi:hypothetical protein
VNEIVKNKNIPVAIAGIFENCDNLTQQDAPHKTKNTCSSLNVAMSTYADKRLGYTAKSRFKGAAVKTRFKGASFRAMMHIISSTVRLSIKIQRLRIDFVKFVPTNFKENFSNADRKRIRLLIKIKQDGVFGVNRSSCRFRVR